MLDRFAAPTSTSTWPTMRNPLSGAGSTVLQELVAPHGFRGWVLGPSGPAVLRDLRLPGADLHGYRHRHRVLDWFGVQPLPVVRRGGWASGRQPGAAPGDCCCGRSPSPPSRSWHWPVCRLAGPGAAALVRAVRSGARRRHEPAVRLPGRAVPDAPARDRCRRGDGDQPDRRVPGAPSCCRSPSTGSAYRSRSTAWRLFWCSASRSRGRGRPSPRTLNWPRQVGFGSLRPRTGISVDTRSTQWR